VIAIPAIDIIAGGCVRLIEGRYDRVTQYEITPVEWARRIEEHGFPRLHVVDLDGARNGTVTNLEVLRELAAETTLKIDFGGGIRTAGDVDMVLDAGAEMVTVGSIAARQPDLFAEWIATYGAHRFVVAADARKGKIATHGWQESSELDVDAFVSDCAQSGIGEFICTDIARDGRLDGPSIALYRRLVERNRDTCIIASGGIRDSADMRELEQTGVCAAIVGKALFEGMLTLDELREWGGRSLD
jgi:phosphoribosylformimino-5-aminoimidazole carboxamide ribotide isomerase